MLFSDAIEVAIGLSFVFLLMSLVLTAVTETVEAAMRTRGSTLLDGIVELIADPRRRDDALKAVEELYSHPLIHGLFRGDFAAARMARQLPSYIPARNFALALIDQALAARLDAAPSDASLPVSATPAERLRLAAERIRSEPLRRAVTQAVALGEGDMERIRQALEAWYDSAMDRVSGWYRRRTQRFLFLLGLGAAVVLNVNALTIADSLSTDAALRRAIAEQAAHFTGEAQQQAPSPTPEANAGQGGPNAAPAAGPAEGKGPRASAAASAGLGAIAAIGLPIGWSEGAREALGRPLDGEGGWWLLGALQILLGFLITALATTLGAPFWFDLLNRLMVVRATVKPHEKSPEEASQDRQDAARPARQPAPAPAGPAGPVLRAEDADPVVHLLDPMQRPREEADHDPPVVMGAA